MSASEGKWERLRAERMQSPAFRERYERTRQSLREVQAVLAYLDDRREAVGLSKAALAREIGTHPAVVRRLFSSGAGNPTLKTVMDVMDALGLEMQFSPRNGQPL
jgi:DNA-binding phage protein